MSLEGLKPFPRDPRYGATPDGRVFRIVRARFGKPVPSEMAQTVGRHGYLYVGNGSNRGLRTVAVHRVVAETFVPNPKGLPEVAHNNGVCDDNREENLRWDTHTGNQADRLLHGTHNRGTRQGRHKLTELDVYLLRHRKVTAGAVARLRGAAIKHVKEVQKGKDWPHVEPQ